MESKELKFKTNINCGGCIAKVKPVLDTTEGISKWEVDTDNTAKILTIKSEGISEDEIITIIKTKGFNIEKI